MKDNYYWTILIEDSSVSASLWVRKGEETTVLSLGTQQEIIDGDYTKAIDLAIASCSDDVPEEAGEPSATVFGVPPTWVLGGSITQPYLGWLKKTCDELGLIPSGFIVLTEAIVHDTKQREGVSLSSFLIARFGSVVVVSRFNMGQPSGSVSFEYTDNQKLIESLSGSFSKLAPKPDVPPSRIILYGSGQKFSQVLSDILVENDWAEVSQGEISFLQTPQVEIFPTTDLLIAVSVAASSEMGTVSSVTIPTLPQEAEVLEEFPQHEEVDQNIDQNIVIQENDIDELGFVYGKDIDDAKEAVPDQKYDFESIASPTISTQSFEEPVIETREGASAKTHSTPSKKFAFPKVARKFESSGRRNNKTKVILGVFLFILLSLGLAWYFLPSANVVVSVSPRALSVREVFSVSETAAFDPNTKTIPVTVIRQNLRGQKTIPATGTKTVGERAKGTVVVRNGTASAIKLPAGTLLTSSNNLRFTTDLSASVSAAVSPTTPGTSQLSVSASQIGSDYNLPSSESLTVGGFSKSEIDAVVETGLTGGSSRQVTSVSKSDLDAVEVALRDELIQKLRDQIEGSIPENSLFIPESVRTAVATREFDRKVGDEASSVGLTMSTDATGLVMSKEVLSMLAQTYIGPQVPDGFLFDPSLVEVSVVAPQNGQVTSLEIVLTANLLPDIDPDQLATRLAGKRPEQAQNELGLIPGFTRANVSITPPVPAPIRFMPFVKDRIQIEIEKSR